MGICDDRPVAAWRTCGRPRRYGGRLTHCRTAVGPARPHWPRRRADGGAVRSGSDAAKPFLAPTGPGAGRAPATQAGKRRSEMDRAEKGAFIRLHGLAEYERLPT